MIANAVQAGATGPTVDRAMADLAYASGDYAKALPGYLRALVGNSGDAMLYEHAGLSALRVGDLGQAVPLLERATAFPNATWRSWNARGVAADYRRDWPVADESYARAAALSPQRAEVFNNAGWSLLVRVPAARSEEQIVLDLLERDQVLVHPGFFFDLPHEAFLVVSLLPASDAFAAGFDRMLRHVHS